MHSGDVYVYLVSISHLVLLSSVAHGAHLCHGNRCVSIFGWEPGGREGRHGIILEPPLRG